MAGVAAARDDFSGDPASDPRRCSFVRSSGRRPAPTAVLAHRSVRRTPANERSLPERTSSNRLDLGVGLSHRRGDPQVASHGGQRP